MSNQEKPMEQRTIDADDVYRAAWSQTKQTVKLVRMLFSSGATESAPISLNEEAILNIQYWEGGQCFVTWGAGQERMIDLLEQALTESFTGFLSEDRDIPPDVARDVLNTKIGLVLAKIFDAHSGGMGISFTPKRIHKSFAFLADFCQAGDAYSKSMVASYGKREWDDKGTRARLQQVLDEQISNPYPWVDYMLGLVEECMARARPILSSMSRGRRETPAKMPEGTKTDDVLPMIDGPADIDVLRVMPAGILAQKKKGPAAAMEPQCESTCSPRGLDSAEQKVA